MVLPSILLVFPLLKKRVTAKYVESVISVHLYIHTTHGGITEMSDLH